jgi:hypothetical protein
MPLFFTRSTIGIEIVRMIGAARKPRLSTLISFSELLVMLRSGQAIRKFNHESGITLVRRARPIPRAGAVTLLAMLLIN